MTPDDTFNRAWNTGDGGAWLNGAPDPAFRRSMEQHPDMIRRLREAEYQRDCPPLDESDAERAGYPELFM